MRTPRAASQAERPRTGDLPYRFGHTARKGPLSLTHTPTKHAHIDSTTRPQTHTSLPLTHQNMPFPSRSLNTQDVVSTARVLSPIAQVHCHEARHETRGEQRPCNLLSRTEHKETKGRRSDALHQTQTYNTNMQPPNSTNACISVQLCPLLTASHPAARSHQIGARSTPASVTGRFPTLVTGR